MLLAGGSGVRQAAPAPVVNAWDKPIRLTTTSSTVTTATSAAAAAPSAATVKYGDKGEQHDSGIELNEALNSASSSTRSSPSGDSKTPVTVQAKGQEPRKPVSLYPTYWHLL